MRTLPTLLMLALSSAACTSDSPDAPRPADIPANDVSFIDGMVPHHQGAIDMANEELARGASDDVRAVAQMITTTQQQEIQMLTDIRADVSGSRTIEKRDDPHMESDIQLLKTLSGVDLDVAFLDNMVPHHANAVVMAHRALENLDRQDLIEFAHKTIDSQTDQMKQLLDMKHAIDPSR